MTRRSAWCRCCQQAAARTLCEPCGLALATHDGRTAAIIRRLFGEEGWVKFTTTLRAERVKASRTRGRKTDQQPQLLVQQAIPGRKPA